MKSTCLGGLTRVFHRWPAKDYSLSFRQLGFGPAILCHSDRSRTSRAPIVCRGRNLSSPFARRQQIQIATKPSAILPLKGERNWSRTEPGPDWAFRNLDKISCGRVDPDWLARQAMPILRLQPSRAQSTPSNSTGKNIEYPVRLLPCQYAR